ncbi:MAG: 23S rRNA (uracil(1939)-C(5))-methyltransferase RlmD [Lachnospiraceae bacterium]|nr:23S rRNA (uracil(1939)-C(5))-methyltransferase RlmD [Lachnospiraceae bacterium]
MKKGELVEGIVKKISFPNKCEVITAEGESVYVKNGLIGQEVSVRVLKKRHGVCEGDIMEVIKPADNELLPPACPHFNECGGCTYQNLSYEDQIALKEGQLREIFEEVLPKGAFTEVWEGVKRSPKQFEYRNKMEFSFGDLYKDGPLSLGMHKRGSFYDVVPVLSCKIVDEDYRKILNETLMFFRGVNATYFHKIRHEGYLRHLLVRKAVATGEIMIDLVTTASMNFESGYADEDAMLNAYKDCLLSLTLDGRIVSVLHTKNDSVADTINDEGTDILYGQDHFHEELLGLKFKISPFSFFQTNSLGAELLYDTAREFIGDAIKEGATVFDLYSGTGTIAQVLSPAAGRVVGVEIVPEAVEAAKVNAKINNLGNCEFIAADVLKALDEITDKPDFIVLDPPRDGIHPKALEKIIDYSVDRMIYISCKPTSLARDLKVLQARGYRVERMCAVDMFPGTVHVESVALLERGENIGNQDY